MILQLEKKENKTSKRKRYTFVLHNREEFFIIFDLTIRS